MAFHYDSLSPINGEEAEGAARKLGVLLGLGEGGKRGSAGGKEEDRRVQERSVDDKAGDGRREGEEQEGGKRVRVIEMEECPQQANSSDCGVFVCMIMRHLLLKKLLRNERTEKVDLSMGRSTVNAAGGRKEMARIIEGFREEGKRRRS